MQDQTFKYPRPAVGYIFSVSALVFAAAAFILGDRHALITPTLKALSGVYALVAGAYYLMSVYRLHQILEQATNGRHPVAPMRAVLLGLIPFYNLYWLFKWSGEIALFMNGVKKEKRFDQNRYGFFLVLGYLAGVFIPGVSQIVSFTVIGSIVRHLQTVLAAHTLPIENYDTEVFDAKPAIIMAVSGSILMMGMVLTVLAPQLKAAAAGLKSQQVNSTGTAS